MPVLPYTFYGSPTFQRNPMRSESVRLMILRIMEDRHPTHQAQAQVRTDARVLKEDMIRKPGVGLLFYGRPETFPDVFSGLDCA